MSAADAIALEFILRDKRETWADDKCEGTRRVGDAAVCIRRRQSASRPFQYTLCPSLRRDITSLSALSQEGSWRLETGGSATASRIITCHTQLCCLPSSSVPSTSLAQSLTMEASDTKHRPSADEKRRPSDLGLVETYTEEEEKALVRKIDTVILPFVSPYIHYAGQLLTLPDVPRLPATISRQAKSQLCRRLRPH